ncbi:MAG: bifunctional phosphopantothenoylcysteine decarboxylase/phosphopantothenate--cysteine ligase CoaBC [Candidatus Bipolaricaulia bacterium]
MTDMSTKTVVCGICGGIAAYKAAGVVSQLRQRGADVHVVMTDAARQFVTPLTFEALSDRPVLGDLWQDAPLEHVRLAHRADLAIIMPATFDVVGKLAHGLADDYLTTLMAACPAPTLVVPAMETTMIDNPIYRRNRRILQARGYRFLEAEEGALASGRTGRGRFPGEDRVTREAESILAFGSQLAGQSVLVTAGPTRERLDPMRVITNRSSGKMGYALAEAARDAGAACVTLVSGPTQLPEPAGVATERVESTADMRDAVLRLLPSHDVIVMAAAVSDWQPNDVAEGKTGKLSTEERRIELEPTPDILHEIHAALGGKSSRPLIVGFAAETDDLLEKARSKLSAKGLDLVVANDISKSDVGAESDDNVVTLIYPNGHAEELPRQSKRALAREILARIAPMLSASSA